MTNLGEMIDHAAQVAGESHHLLRLDDAARRIAGYLGEPDRADEIAEALLRACMIRRVPVEIEHWTVRV